MVHTHTEKNQFARFGDPCLHQFFNIRPVSFRLFLDSLTPLSRLDRYSCKIELCFSPNIHSDAFIAVDRETIVTKVCLELLNVLFCKVAVVFGDKYIVSVRHHVILTEFFFQSSD